MNPLYPLRGYRWSKTRIEIWGPRLGCVEALAGLRVRFLRINSFDRWKNCQSTNINQDDNWCYKCCCSSTDLLASFFVRRQTCGGRFFLRTIRTSPDVTSLTSPDVTSLLRKTSPDVTSFLRKIFTAWFLCAPIIPGVFDPSFIRILCGFHFQVHFQVFMSFKPKYSSSCPYFCPCQLTSVDSDHVWRFQSCWRFWVI